MRSWFEVFTEKAASADLGRREAVRIAAIIQDEIGGEVCTPELAEAAADRIVCALNNRDA